MIQSLSNLQAVGAFLGTGVDDTGAVPITGVSIDSRTIRPGELFFAVRGENTDGHLYVEKALAAGASGAVVEQRTAGKDAARLLVVNDSLSALQMLGAEARRRWGKPVIGVTGSAGKTTTKDMIAGVLSRKYRVRKTEGNYNNAYGVPLTLLRIEDSDEIAVVEMAMNHAGEIAALAKLARPESGVITNVAPAHLEFFESIEGIARAKYELIEALPSTGSAVLNADDLRVSKFAFAGKRVTYGIENAADFRATDIEDGETMRFHVGATQFELPVPGRHQIRNALAAIATGALQGVSPSEAAEALRAFAPSKMRGQTIEWKGARLINDCYNSNPQAALSMLDWLSRAPATGRRAAVLGEMLELGPAGIELHQRVGEAARGLDLLVAVRGLARHIAESGRGQFVETPEDAAEAIAKWIRPGDLVLFKASRGVRLERAIETLMKVK